MGAGRPEPGPGEHQERLGGGRQITDRRRRPSLPSEACWRAAKSASASAESLSKNLQK